MKTFFTACSQGAGRLLLAAALAAGLPACQQRLEKLEAVQQQQARELTELRQSLAEKEQEVAQLEACVDGLESAVYEAEDSTAAAEPGPTQL